MFSLKLSTNKMFTILLLFALMLETSFKQRTAAAPSQLEKATTNFFNSRLVNISDSSDSPPNFAKERPIETVMQSTKPQELDQQQLDGAAKPNGDVEKRANVTVVTLQNRFALLETPAFCAPGYIYVGRRCRKLV
ncbi:uncharacterized protein LOC128865840 [Anastrepha ludens]|uniref:uncharacterized protein LOC128865840 n=1 Tax=Anastrepha ludens TaxID=28586 RepID=UPI0023AE8FF9|nr:uncharacterized protein LOC128865840 [Anastrepha ludens]